MGITQEESTEQRMAKVTFITGDVAKANAVIAKGEKVLFDVVSQMGCPVYLFVDRQSAHEDGVILVGRQTPGKTEIPEPTPPINHEDVEVRGIPAINAALAAGVPIASLSYMVCTDRWNSDAVKERKPGFAIIQVSGNIEHPSERQPQNSIKPGGK